MASTTTKTVASIATAAAIIGGGIGIYEYYDNDTAQNINQVATSEIDWSLYDLNIPTIELPSLDIPTIEIVSIPMIDTPTIEELKITPLSLPVIDETSLKALNATTKDFESEMAKNSITIEKLPDPSADWDEWITFFEKAKTIFADQRGIQHDKTFNKNNEIIHKWMNIYKEYRNTPDVAFVPIKEKFRMITEVRVPKSTSELSILSENLAYYKSQGYDSVLFCFDKDDDVSKALNTVKYIQKYCGMKVWFAYTGKESLYETVFIDPDKYKEMLTTLAPYCNGFINSWRRTSAHLFEQDKAFMNFTNITLRKAVPNIPIVGELYYGNTHKYDRVGVVGFGINDFKNSSAVMIVNFGFRKIDMNYLFKNILIKYLGDKPKIGCVVGQRPYYLNVQSNGLSYQENMDIKKEIEDKFFKQGCVGVVTLSNDGREMESNNITVTPYNSLNSIGYKSK